MDVWSTCTWGRDASRQAHDKGEQGPRKRPALGESLINRSKGAYKEKVVKEKVMKRSEIAWASQGQGSADTHTDTHTAGGVDGVDGSTSRHAGAAQKRERTIQAAGALNK